MRHKDKVKIAKKMRTPLEAKARVSIFDSIAWNKRSAVIKKRVTK